MKNAIFLFLFLISVSTVAQTANCNIGNESSSGFQNPADPISKNYLLGIKFTVVNDGTLTSLNLVGRNSGSSVKMVLYKDVAGIPGDSIVSTSTGSVTNGVVSLPVTPFILPAGDYWIMAIYNQDGKHTFSKTLSNNKIYYTSMDFSDAIPANASDFTTISNTTFTYFLGITCGTNLATSKATTSSILNFYPNPVTDLITINTQPNLIGESYRIANISGTQVVTGQLTSETHIVDVNALQAGLYFMIIGDKEREVIKFIKQ